jgi:hypothetical protein
VDVKFRGRGLAGEFSKSLNQLFLEVICNIVLLAEEDHTTLRDYQKKRLAGI